MNGPLDHARGWLRKAESDRTSARQLLAAGGPSDAVCFHAQQHAEKLLKAMLAFHDRPIPHVHNIEELQRECLAVAADPELASLDLAVLTPYAVEMRYDFEFWPDEATARAAVDLAERLRSVVLARIPAE